MRYTTPRRKTVVLFLLAALLIAPWASAGPRHGSAHPARVYGDAGIPDLFGQAWSFLVGVWSKIGCNIDPNGRCLPAPLVTSPVSSADIGCNIDPNGRCIP